MQRLIIMHKQYDDASPRITNSCASLITRTQLYQPLHILASIVINKAATTWYSKNHSVLFIFCSFGLSQVNYYCNVVCEIEMENSSRSPTKATAEVDEEKVGLVVAMGFGRAQAVDALAVNNNHVAAAIEWIETKTRAAAPDNDGEFDLIGAAPTAPSVASPTVFKSRTGGHTGVDHFASSVPQGSIAEMVDARISNFTEMGFSHEQAMAALKRANNDVNEALTLLLNGGGNDLI
jgi:NACalpha-BTF3-like transcription factor